MMKKTGIFCVLESPGVRSKAGPPTAKHVFRFKTSSAGFPGEQLLIWPLALRLALYLLALLLVAFTLDFLTGDLEAQTRIHGHRLKGSTRELCWEWRTIDLSGYLFAQIVNG
jgi:hypothetical protein